MQLKVRKISVGDTIRPADVPAVLSAHGIGFNAVSCDNWSWSDCNPRVDFRIAHTGDSILLHFRVKDGELRAMATCDGGRVWEDSCCEFFLSPDCDGNYYNFECNCLGVLLLHGGEGTDRPDAPRHAYDEVKRWSSLQESGSAKTGLVPGSPTPVGTDLEWDLVEIIPASALFNHRIPSFDGRKMRANFYKCGDLLSSPHFLSWAPISLPEPKFHCPEFFGDLEFEAYSLQELRTVAGAFELKGEIKDITPLGNGLINDTFRIVTTQDAPDYVLQRINDAVFRDVDMLQHNIEVVTGHIRSKLEAEGVDDIDRKVLNFIRVRGSDKTYVLQGGKYWRVSVMIRDAMTFETVNPEYSYYAGKAFGDFEAKLLDVAGTLGETIPDFHNMELRSRQLKQAIADDKAGRVADPQVQEIIRFLSEYDCQMCAAERLHREGKLPKRICHCDTKVNNMLFDKQGNVLCVIDLDTVMPSFVFSDFGDFMRTAGNTVAEDSPETDKVAFRMDIFEAFARGYLESASSFLTPIEREYLPYAVLLFPYMQAVRFFADYLNGDTYYKIKYPDHNLVRTRNQIALFKSALSHLEQMKEVLCHR